MVPQRTTRVNTEDEDAEDEEDDENYKEISNELSNKCFFLIDIKCVRSSSVWKSPSVKFVFVS